MVRNELSRSAIPAALAPMDLLVRTELGRMLYSMREDHTWAERASRIYPGIRSVYRTN